MFKNLLKNWKTTAAGLTTIAGSVVHLIFSVRAGTADEAVWTATLTAVVLGVGLILAGDASASAQAHEETKNLIASIDNKIAVNTKAIITGDTSQLQKSELAKPSTPGIT